MKRDPIFHQLSSDHHDGLVIGRKIRRACAERGSSLEQAVEAVRAFDRGLAHHFAVEEAALLPALERCGETELVERVRADHELLRSLRSVIVESGDPIALEQFGTALEQHIRFEERTVFEVAQQKLSREELDWIARTSAGVDEVIISVGTKR